MCAVMPRLGACVLVMAFAGCGLSEKDQVPTPQLSAVAPVAAEWPAAPVSAFRPAKEGACPPRYRLHDSLCVHVAMRGRVSESKLESLLAAYRAGAAAPRVGGGPAPLELPEPVIQDSLDPSKLPPDALTTKRLDATEARDERLRQLDEMIRSARIRAGESPDSLAPVPPPSAIPRRKQGSSDAVQPLPPSAVTSATGDTKTLSEMTKDLPPEVLRALLADIRRIGGTQMVPAEELEALQRRVSDSERGEAKPDEVAQPADPTN